MKLLGAHRANTWAVGFGLATAELLVARATGGTFGWGEAAAATVLAVGLGAFGRPLFTVLVYLAGLLVPALWGRGVGVGVWVLLGAALALVSRRHPLGARSAIAAYAGAIGVVWLVVGVGEGSPPPAAVVGFVAAALLACAALGRWAWVLVPIAAWPTAPTPWTATGVAPTGPDILLVSIDTLRLDAARSMRSMHDGTLLEAQAPAPWTLPSLATLQTGLLPAHHGALRVRTGFSATTAPTLAERLAAAGWDTAATVESPFVDTRFGLQRGYARVRADGARPWVLPRSPWGDHARPTAALLLAAVGLVPLEDGGAERRARDLAEFVAERRDRPLFVWVHLLDVHLPYRHALSLDLPLADRLWLTTAHRLSIGPTPDDATLALLRRAYDHEVSVVDAILPRLRAAMPDAVTIVTADHGEELGEHGGFEHGHSFYQEVLAVPLLVDGLAVAAQGPVGLQDVAPTLLGVAGLAADGLDGRDLRLPGAAPLPSVNLLYGPLDARAVRDGAQKLVAEGEGRRAYDLEADPGERAPISGDTRLETLLPAVPGAEGAAVPIDAATTEALRALGYVQ